MAILGLVTLGHTPRPDLEVEFQRHAPAATIHVVGALEEYSPNEAHELAAIPGDYPLLVRLSDGRAVNIQRAVLIPLVERKAQELAMAGARLVVIVCAGAFPEISCPSIVLYPGKILPAIARTICRTRRIGIVTSVAGQISAARDKWTQDGFQVKVTYAAPFQYDEIQRAATAMSDPSLEIVVLDCMGHGLSDRAKFAELCGRPVLLSQSLMARVAGELIEL